mmetsp:Transcript_113672/g.196669  ORF Transcript_113672/g.196669 Transcript_113672/m.196669 type:complete len:214 (+) Transcript_113672:3-644(+)
MMMMRVCSLSTNYSAWCITHRCFSLLSKLLSVLNLATIPGNTKFRAHLQCQWLSRSPSWGSMPSSSALPPRPSLPLPIAAPKPPALLLQQPCPSPPAPLWQHTATASASLMASPRHGCWQRNARSLAPKSKQPCTQSSSSRVSPPARQHTPATLGRTAGAPRWRAACCEPEAWLRRVHDHSKMLMSVLLKPATPHPAKPQALLGRVFLLQRMS